MSIPGLQIDTTVKQPDAVPGKIRVQAVFVGALGDSDLSWRQALAETVPGHRHLLPEQGVVGIEPGEMAALFRAEDV